MLRPVQDERVFPFVGMDGQLVRHANLLQVDFVRADFDRQVGSPADPSREAIEAVVSNVVVRLRYTIGAPTFREFRLLETFWTVRYLADDGADVAEVKGLVRGRVHAPFRFRFTGLDPSSWNAVEKLPLGFQPHIWERLYLGALFLLPEVGPALTLGIAAIETATDQMIRDRMPGREAEAKNLISSNRLGQRLDTVTKRLAGVSLKTVPALWQAFQRLRRARNAAAHEGKSIFDGVMLDDRLAQDLILGIRPIPDWLEALMPSAHRNHRDLHEPKWEWRSPVQSDNEAQV